MKDIIFIMIAGLVALWIMMLGFLHFCPDRLPTKFFCSKCISSENFILPVIISIMFMFLPMLFNGFNEEFERKDQLAWEKHKRERGIKE